MRPRRLVVRGFTCFRDEVEIDFTPLDLFAITGPTGAGKTSILDAMTLALYGRVYRVEGVRSIISLGAKEMRIHFEFSVGLSVYRVTRVGFAGTRASQVGLDRALGNGEWEPLAKGAREAENKIATLLGLDFEGFTKAVLLPQNAFSRFLQGEPSERRSILEALLGLEIYEGIQKRANQVAEARRQETDLLGQQLTRDYKDATPERVEELEAAARVAAEHVTEMRAARAASAEALELAREVTHSRNQALGLSSQCANLVADCENLEREARAGEKALSALTDSAIALDREVAEVAYDDARHLLLGTAEPHAVRREQIMQRLAVLDADARTHAANLKTAQEEHRLRQSELTNGRATLAQRQQELAGAERRANTLERQYGTVSAIALIQQIERQWRDDRRALEVLEVEVVGLEARQMSLEADVERLRGEAVAAESALAAAQAAKAEADRWATEFRELETRVLALRRQMGELAEDAEEADATLDEKRRAEDGAERTVAKAERSAAAARDALSNAETILTELRFENAAYALRTRLSVGAPCPVCEQRITETPAAHPEHTLTEAEAAATRARERVQTEQKMAQRAAQALTRVQTELDSVASAKADAEAKLESLSEELAALLPPEFAGSADRIPGLKQEAAAAVATAERRVVDARAVVTRAQTAVARVEGELRGLPALASRRETHATLHAKCDTAAKQVQRVCGRLPGAEAAAELAVMATRFAEAATAKNAAASAVSPTAVAVHELELACERLIQRVGSEEQAARAATEERERLTNERRQVEGALKAAGIALSGDVLGMIRAELGRLAGARLARDRLLVKRAEITADHACVQEEVATLRGRRVEREQQRNAVAVEAQAAREEVQGVRARLAAAVRAGAWPGWDEVDAAGTEEAWLAVIAKETEAAHERAVAEHTTLSTEARALAARLERANECRVRHAEAQREANLAGELGQLLMANRFRSYLLEEAVRTLAADGSRHLQELSGGRYAFHTEGAEFQIVDGWNADEQRSVKTLSGGETFLASLALALGLAEGLPALGPGEHGHQRLESLFIDEGFGTLDPDETLDTVTQALENLRTSDRIVGIVTHLPQLAERLPAQIRVVKSQMGSHIEVTSE